MAKTAVTTKSLPTRAVAARHDDDSLPDFMRQDLGAGHGNIGREDMEVPRLKLMQGLSPELNEFNKLRPGMFFHTAAEHIFEGPFLAVPIYMDKRFILWRPRDSGGGILARADDGIHWAPADTEFEVKLDKKDGGVNVKWRTAKTVKQSGLAEWGSMNPQDTNSPPAATLMYNFVLGFPEHPDLLPAVLTFQRSSIKYGRRLITKIKTQQAPIFGLQFEFSSISDTNSSNQPFHNIQVKGAGKVQDQDLYRAYRDLNQSFAQAGLSVKDLETIQDEEAGDAAEDDEKDAPPVGKNRPRY